jgi:pimeloyl-ACP methyl ester carboxylesterase
MKIVLIAGTWYREDVYLSIWGNIQSALKYQYPEASFVCKQAVYHLWNLDIMKSLGNSIVAEEDTGEDILLLGHSMGGIIACGIASKFKKSRVVGVVTIFSPHMLGKVIPGLDYTRILFGKREKIPAPVISFGGAIDPLVWSMFTAHPNALHHEILWSDHRFLLGSSQEVSDRIANVVRDFVEPISAV